MKILMLWGIRLYWLLVPRARRRQCLFRESCSQHVFRLTSAGGARSGLSALQVRWHRCRPGYSIVPRGDGLALLCVDGTVIDAGDVAPAILAPFEQAMSGLERRLLLEEAGEDQAGAGR